jgi:hypothetical protein
MHNGYRFAQLSIGESLTSPTVCECCEREDLKRTVKLVSPEGRAVWFGTGCAARAMGIAPKLVRAAKRDAEATAVAEQDAIVRAQRASVDAAWQAFLDATAGVGERFSQIERLGGYKVARALFEKR